MVVVIGVDPHKGSHTAVAIDANERQLGRLQVRSGPRQVAQLLEWAAAFDERTWAIESAGGLGYLLSQQLVGAGERVLDVPATLASRVRVLATSKSQKTDPHDALSIAIAALRAPDVRLVARADHAGRNRRRHWRGPRRIRLPAALAAADSERRLVGVRDGARLGQRASSAVARILHRAHAARVAVAPHRPRSDGAPPLQLSRMDAVSGEVPGRQTLRSNVLKSF